MANMKVTYDSLKVYHPDFHSRTSTKILATVTTRDAAKVRVRLTGTGGYAATLASATAPTRPDAVICTLDLTTLATGSYTLTTEVLDFADAVLASHVDTFTRAISGSPAVGIDSENNLVMGGSPWIPYTDYFGQMEYMPGRAAANQINSTEVQEWNTEYTPTTLGNALDLLNTIPIKGIMPVRPGNIDPKTATLANWVTPNKAKPALLMWQWMDEPEYNSSTPAEARSWTETTHAADAEHPVCINLVGMHFGDGVGEFEAMVAKSWTLDRWAADLLPVTDYLSTDWYPVDFYPKHGITLQRSMDIFQQQIVNIRAWTKDLVPIKTFIEVVDIDIAASPAPTGEQVWCEVWLAFACGCKGISWFPLTMYTPAHPQEADVPPMMTKVGQYIDHFTPMLSAPTSSKVTRTYASGDRVDFIAKEYGGKLYIFAVNYNVTSSAEVTFTLSGFPISTVTVYGESRTINPTGHGFTDTFAAYAVHIYEIA